MTDIGKASELLVRYIRSQSFPVAVKMLQASDELPDRARSPKRDLGFQVSMKRRKYSGGYLGRAQLFRPLSGQTRHHYDSICVLR
jgi:uncharacterized protein (DUF169 family)